MSPRQLSLEVDLRWWPLEQALEHHRRQRGPEPTQTDFNKALEAGALRALAQHADGLRELLLASVWGSDFCIEMQLRVSDSRPSLELFSRKLGKRLRPAELSVFVWEPDYKNIWLPERATPTATKGMQEKLDKSGRPQTIRRQELREEIVRRCWQKGRFIAPESHTILITELRAWHKRKFKNEPNYDDLRKFVGDAIAILKLTGK